MKINPPQRQMSAGADQALGGAMPKFYQTFFSLVSEGMFVLEAKGKLLEANKKICQIFGYAHDELIGLHISNLVAWPEINNTWLVPLKAGLLSKQVDTFLFRRKDGSCFNAQMAFAMLPDDNVLGVVCQSTVCEGDNTTTSWLAAIVESSDDAIISKDLNSIVSSWNAGAERIFGYTAKEMLGTSITRLIPDERKDEETVILEKIRRGERVDHFETVRLAKDQRPINVSVTISPVRDASGQIVGASKIARDITKLKVREREKENMSRLYAALAQINQEIPRTQTRESLFQKTCRLFVEYGGLQMAWIGCLDPETHLIVPVAVHKDESDIPCKFPIYAENPLKGCGPTAISFCTGAPYICSSMPDDPTTKPWADEIERLGYRASATFLIKENGQVGGILNVFSNQQNFFLDDETRLMEEAVKDISFALDNIVLKELRTHSELSALNEKSFTEAMIESLPGVVCVFNEKRQILRWNKNLNVVTGYSDAEIAQMHPLDFFQNERKGDVEQIIAEVFETGEAMTEASLLGKNGKSPPFIFTGRRVVLNGNACVLSIGIDISKRKEYERQLQEQDRLLKDMSAMAHVGGWEFDPETGNGKWTEEIARIHDVSPEAATNVDFGLSFFQGESRKKIETAVREAIEHRKAYDLELEMVTASGQHKWVRTIGYPIVRKGKAVKICGSMQDITERKMADIKNKRLNRMLAVLNQINSLIIRAQNREELFSEVCKIATTSGEFRMSMLAIVDRDNACIVPVAWEGKDTELMDSIRKVLSSSQLSTGTMVAKAIREKQPVVSNDSQNDPSVLFSCKYAEAGVNSMAVLPLVVSDEARGILALYSVEKDFFRDEEMHLLRELTGDIAFSIDHIDKHERLNYLAYYDSLTGLSNRNMFLERVGQFIRNTPAKQKLALLLLDLDRFKSVNDSLGISAGDVLLIQVASWLANNAKDANLVARIGADSFAVVLPVVKDGDEVAHQVEKTIASLSKQVFVVGESEIRISIKMGIALYPDDGIDEEALFKNAEAAHKLAKRRGEQYLFHTKKMTESVAAKLSLENQLRHAIDNEEFVLYYQPKVGLATGKVSDAEALIRWKNPHVGLIPPGDFIPILEETGMIYEVGRWALRTAIKDSLRWRKEGFPAVRLAVNVSPLQLRSPSFISEIKQNVSVDDQAAARLQLEITESLIMENVEENIVRLRAIRDMGVGIAIDDFGTGFSSLSYLVKLPLDTLKIDRAFVISMMNGPKELAVVSSTINLAHSLNLDIVAEGVETEEQARLLRLLGCDQIQGYLFSEPVPAEVFEAKYLSNQRDAQRESP